jgi:hypothetical protein
LRHGEDEYEMWGGQEAEKGKDIVQGNATAETASRTRLNERLRSIPSGLSGARRKGTTIFEGHSTVESH